MITTHALNTFRPYIMYKFCLNNKHPATTSHKVMGSDCIFRIATNLRYLPIVWT